MVDVHSLLYKDLPSQDNLLRTVTKQLLDVGRPEIKRWQDVLDTLDFHQVFEYLQVRLLESEEAIPMTNIYSLEPPAVAAKSNRFVIYKLVASAL
jgi:hypothetical protein